MGDHTPARRADVLDRGVERLIEFAVDQIATVPYWDGDDEMDEHPAVIRAWDAAISILVRMEFADWTAWGRAHTRIGDALLFKDVNELVAAVRDALGVAGLRREPEEATGTTSSISG